MKVSAVFSLLAAYAFRNVAAWGIEGHMAVGYIAMEFLSPNALSFVQSSLGAKYSKSLGPAATWADSVKYTKGYTWSKPYHYIDAEDSPLNGQCSVNVSRDASKGNTLLNAISNYTSRLGDESLSATQRQEALKFLDHFIGDIGQPLHVEAYKVGGNSIPTICGGSSTELHATWDTGIIETMLESVYSSDAASNASIQAWAGDLIQDIKTGVYSTDAAEWIQCSSITQPASTSSTGSAIIPPLACPLLWARESNAYDCTVVFSYTEGDDLCQGTYYDMALAVINEQIAKQGYRLAAWLNEILDGTSSTSFGLYKNS